MMREAIEGVTDGVTVGGSFQDVDIAKNGASRLDGTHDK